MPGQYVVEPLGQGAGEGLGVHGAAGAAFVNDEGAVRDLPGGLGLRVRAGGYGLGHGLGGAVQRQGHRVIRLTGHRGQEAQPAGEQAPVLLVHGLLSGSGLIKGQILTGEAVLSSGT